jgi:hypothetical protein
MLEVRGKDDKRYLVMSSAAHQSPKPKQIEQRNTLQFLASLDTIEAVAVEALGA